MLTRAFAAKERLALALRDIECQIKWLRNRAYYESNFQRLVQSRKWVFIVGCNNSGTTILHDALARAPGVGYLAKESQMYTRVFRRARKKGFERVWTEYLMELTVARGANPAARYAHDVLYRMPRPIPRIILDKCTPNSARLTWFEEAFCRPFFVAVVRDGHAVAEGIRRKGGKDVGRGAKHWNRVNELMVEQSRLVKHYLEVRYERFVMAPAVVLQEIAEFLGEEPSYFTSALSADRLASGHKGAQPDLKDMNPGSFRRLTEADIAEIETYAAPMLHYYSYGRPLA